MVCHFGGVYGQKDQDGKTWTGPVYVVPVTLRVADAKEGSPLGEYVVEEDE